MYFRSLPSLASSRKYICLSNPNLKSENARRSIYTLLNEQMDLNGKKAFISGGANGIGLSAAESLLKAGVEKVFISDIDENNGKKNVDRINNEYKKDVMGFMKSDLRNLSEVCYAFEAASKYFEGPMDIVFNNAGVLCDKNWEDMIRLNCNALLQGTLLGLQYMGVENGGKGGAIINNACIFGLGPCAGCPVYVGTKHFVIGLTRSFAMPFHFERSNVRMLTLCPGITETKTLIGIGNQQFTPDWGKELENEISALDKQSSSYAGGAVVYMLKYGENGGIFVSEGKAIYQVEIPPRLAMATQAIMNACGCALQMRELQNVKQIVVPTAGLD